MKKVLLLLVWLLVLSSICYSKDVYIEGYYRKDGTYVRPHYRSSPDKYKWNNYGPSKSDQELLNPNLRDNDRDGIPNRYDIDDDNDSIYDDYDSNQYSPKSKSFYQNEKPFNNRLYDYQYFQEKSFIVYVTKTGAKYHRASCRYLRRSSIPMSLENAKRRYSPCSVCNPPR